MMIRLVRGILCVILLNGLPGAPAPRAALAGPAHGPLRCGTLTIVPSPNRPALHEALSGVVALTSRNVWIVGYSSDPLASNRDRTLIKHWDGFLWKVVPSPAPGEASRLLGISAVAANDIWAVGYYDTTRIRHTLLLHWDGNAWTVGTSPPSREEGYSMPWRRAPRMMCGPSAQSGSSRS
jgi:hypothetical protein